MTTRRSGEWFESFTGKRIFILDPRPEDICLIDIAVSLSHVCRFGGHVSRHYSVAEHSLNVCELVYVSFNTTTKMLRTALLHDATEAYLGDMVNPFKRTPEMSVYRDLEDKWWKVLCDKYDLEYDLPEFIKNADVTALASERVALRPISIRDWNLGRESDSYLKFPVKKPHDVAKAFFAKALELGVDELWQSESSCSSTSTACSTPCRTSGVSGTTCPRGRLPISWRLRLLRSTRPG